MHYIILGSGRIDYDYEGSIRKRTLPSVLSDNSNNNWEDDNIWPQLMLIDYHDAYIQYDDTVDDG